MRLDEKLRLYHDRYGFTGYNKVTNQVNGDDGVFIYQVNLTDDEWTENYRDDISQVIVDVMSEFGFTGNTEKQMISDVQFKYLQRLFDVRYKPNGK